MSYGYRLINALKIMGLISVLGISVCACAGLPRSSSSITSWKEEALLHDGSKVIVTRTAKRFGRHEIGQQPPIGEQSLSFTLPSSSKKIIWEDKFAKDLGSANFLPMMLEISKDTAYLVVYPMGCLSYNKWGRPNPPYVVFRYQDKNWNRIAVEELPTEFKRPNLIFSSPDDEAKKAGRPIVSWEMIRALYDGYSQPEFKIILKEGYPNAGGRCQEMVYYKGAWVGPGDSIGKRIMDKKSK